MLEAAMNFASNPQCNVGVRFLPRIPWEFAESHEVDREVWMQGEKALSLSNPLQANARRRISRCVPIR